mgnify:CR=1 FL=1
MQQYSKDFLEFISKLEKNNVLEELNSRIYRDLDLYRFNLYNKPKKLPIVPLSNNVELTEVETTPTIQFNDTVIHNHLSLLTQRKECPETNPSDYLDRIDTDKPCIIQDIQLDPLQIKYTHTDFEVIALYDEILKKELIQNIYNHVSAKSEHTLNLSELTSNYTYPLRETLFKDTSSISTNISSFYRPINLTVLTLVKSEDSYYILAGKRTESTYQNSGSNTLIPSGFCRQSFITNSNTLIEKFVHLYAQELFNNSSPSIVDPHVQGLIDLVESQNTTFERTGIGINLTSMNLEVTGICIIRNNNYLKTLTNSKVEDGLKNKKLSLIPVSKVEDQLSYIMSSFSASDLFCLNNGLTYFKE